MPSPIAHVTVGYMIYRIFRKHMPESIMRKIGPFALLLPASLFLSMLPDADAVLGILASDLGKYHNNLFHSLIVAVGISVLIATVGRIVFGGKAGTWFLFALLCCGSHVLLDVMTYGRGVMLFWPITEARFQSPVLLFAGLHWSEGVFSITHLWTAANEAFFSMAVLLFGWLLQKMKLETGNSKLG